MDRIVIEVEDSLARRWRNTSPKDRIEIGKSLEKQLDEILREKKETHFETQLSFVREEAASNGLTDEILQKLLNEE